jgi:hypothetical protein
MANSGQCQQTFLLGAPWPASDQCCHLRISKIRGIMQINNISLKTVEVVESKQEKDRNQWDILTEKVISFSLLLR